MANFVAPALPRTGVAQGVLSWTLVEPSARPARPTRSRAARAPFDARASGDAGEPSKTFDSSEDADGRVGRRGAFAAALAGASAAASFAAAGVAAPSEGLDDLCLADAAESCAASAGGAMTSGTISLQTGKGRLSVGIYPDFSYDASGYGGEGTYRVSSDGKRAEFTFPAASLKIPDMDWKTARILGLPLPPFLRIAITPRDSSGFFDLTTGEFEMQFDASFQPYVGGARALAPISVVTALTTEPSEGLFKRAAGRRLDAAGAGRLAGIAVVPRTGDAVMDAFLGLPTDTLSELPVRLAFRPA